CRRCGAEGIPRDSVVRTLAHEPFGHRPTVLKIRVRRYRCAWCQKVWREDTSRAAPVRAKISRAGVRYALEALVIDHLTVARAAANLGVSWRTANSAILDEGQRLLIDDPGRFDGVTTIGVDEHVWRHTRRGDKYVTVIIDLTPVRDKRGPARLLDMVPGRSKQVFSDWLAQRTQAWRDGIEVVAMDGFTGFKTASKQHLPEAVEVMDPFHVVQLAGDALDRVRQRVQQETLGHRGRRGDPLYGVRKVLRTGEAFLTEKQQARLDQVFADPAHADVWRAWRAYQQVVAAYREKHSGLGRKRLRELIDTLKATTPSWFVELRRLAYTLDRRREDILAYFDHPRTSNGPTEAINGRLEHLRGSALGFRNLAHYIARSLLETGGFRPLLHSRFR
ncbi:ISL3 family transposase, partial [Leucobacter sp. wl10]|uniref:ISL3 family transposase n=1 Tax=Leucobacter sp. wl10 TaxID=2304677 RepID=UPI000E5A87B8